MNNEARIKKWIETESKRMPALYDFAFEVDVFLTNPRLGNEY